mmetsp:Transcript_26794/g.72277  ORF Transcript_26794/g.72277 Transcript_26794/m.72277 type:complete len:97 (-) Transcript_26794:152-442(-)
MCRTAPTVDNTSAMMTRGSAFFGGAALFGWQQGPTTPQPEQQLHAARLPAHIPPITHAGICQFTPGASLVTHRLKKPTEAIVVSGIRTTRTEKMMT